MYVWYYVSMRMVQYTVSKMRLIDATITAILKMTQSSYLPTCTILEMVKCTEYQTSFTDLLKYLRYKLQHIFCVCTISSYRCLFCSYLLFAKWYNFICYYILGLQCCKRSSLQEFRLSPQIDNGYANFGFFPNFQDHIFLYN